VTVDGPGLRILAVDDVRLAVDELGRLLRSAPEVAEVTAVSDPLAAVRNIQAERFDAVFLDIAMPGLNGLELATLLGKLSAPPVIVFVTAYDRHAVTAYSIGAVDYLLKPIRAERLTAALTKVVRMVQVLRAEGSDESTGRRPSPDTMAALPVEVDGRARYVRRADVQFVEARGDHVRLYTRDGSYEVRMPISRLEEYWSESGFTRVHRGFLVALGAVRELRSDSFGGVLAHTDLGDVPVSRRHARELREQLLCAAQRGDLDRRS
jgi:DNA-binding LytR/AlgR family response regulator